MKMVTRRDFIKSAGVIVGGSVLSAGSSKLFGKANENYTSNRPPKAKRNFSSKIVDETIDEVKDLISDDELAWMFENCFPNTLDTTVEYSEENGRPDTFVITGDIPAMWLRDSTAQVWPYISLINKDEKLKKLIAGVINRQTKCVLIDPFANAFNKTASGSHWETDITDMKPKLHERKWELDSLCYTIRLAYGYWKESGDNSVFTSEWRKSSELILETIKQMQKDKRESPYSFMRKTQQATDTLPLWGMGNPTKQCGLVNSYFRPSDDACIYSFLIPSNLFAVVSLNQMAEIHTKVYKNSEFAKKCRETAKQISDAINEYAVIDHLDYGKIYAYEVDGFGNRLFMDDANIPSLLSLPYLDVCKENDEIYQHTRNFLHSVNNPYFFQGKSGEGIGGPHVGMDMIWPMSIIMRALTSNKDIEIIKCLKMLKNTHADTGFMHESFNKDNPDKFTRKWFAWANTLFGELILKLYRTNREILKL